MESNTKTQIRIGSFLLVGTIIILTSIFMLGGDKAIFKSYATLHAHFDQVQGLAEGSVISFSGITVGNIARIELLPENNKVDVILQIDEKYLPRITEGSLVEIRTQGALGDKFIFIIPGDPRAKPLTDGANIEVAKATDLIGIISERGNEAEKIFDIINEIYRMTRSLNADNRIDRILTNLSSASGKLDKTAGEAQKTFSALNDGQKLKNTLDRLDSVVTKIDRGQGTLGALINDPSLHDQLKSMLGGSSRQNHMKSLIRNSIEKSN